MNEETWDCKICGKNIWKLYSDRDVDSERGVPTLFYKCLGCGDVKELEYEQVD